MKKVGKHPIYTIVTTNPGNIFINVLEFDLGSLQYQLKTSPVQLPSSGTVNWGNFIVINIKDLLDTTPVQRSIPLGNIYMWELQEEKSAFSIYQTKYSKQLYL